MEQSDVDDDEETEEHMEDLLHQLDGILSSLTRRMIKSDLEDFELVCLRLALDI